MLFMKISTFAGMNQSSDTWRSFKEKLFFIVLILHRFFIILKASKPVSQSLQGVKQHNIHFVECDRKGWTNQKSFLSNVSQLQPSWLWNKHMDTDACRYL